MTINNRVSKYNGLAILNNHVVVYSTPINLNYMWNFGSLAGICLVIHIITYIFLAMHYTPHIGYAFVSTQHIIKQYFFDIFLNVKKTINVKCLH